MKINTSSQPGAIAPRSSAPVDPKQIAASREKLSGLATTAVAKTIVSQPTTPVTSEHPLLAGFGKALGMGLGVIVTEALAIVPGWNKPVLGADGKPVSDVAGATRIGDHNILKRHEEVVGPQVSALVAKLHPGAIHDLLQGFADGATAAPGESYRLESAIADVFEP